MQDTRGFRKAHLHYKGINSAFLYSLLLPHQGEGRHNGRVALCAQWINSNNIIIIQPDHHYKLRAVLISYASVRKD